MFIKKNYCLAVIVVHMITLKPTFFFFSFFFFISKAIGLGSQATLTSKKSLSHHTIPEFTDDDCSLQHDEIIKDRNGRIIPRLLIKAPTMREVKPSHPLVTVDCCFKSKEMH